MSQDEEVSLVDVLLEDEQLEEEASAVLAGSDPHHCSYPRGYVKRQALYACNTCTPAGGAEAGICLACSYNCHGGHDLFELYTKRAFRCDCGNSKFPEDVKCKLYSDKEGVNSLNKYNHNFFGRYCTCQRPYPDPEDTTEDEMIQCVVCEDWLHGRHLGAEVPEGAEQMEMICEACMKKNDFLWTYAAHLTGAPDEATGSGTSQQEAETGTDDVTEPGGKRRRQEAETSCHLKKFQTANREVQKSGAVFWRQGWRSEICRCPSCKESLTAAGLLFLSDDSDTVLSYENEGRHNEQRRHDSDPLMSALNNLDRVQQLEIIHGFNDMKTELKDFLRSFASMGMVVTPEDIRRFFEQQTTRQRNRASDRRL
ncbi:putative E3 ubiquitin-protein ligase UBR7 [Neosynchiropus ocellatus]